MPWLLSATRLVPAVASFRSLSGCLSCSRRRYSLQPIPERRIPNRYLGQPSPFTHPHLLRPVNDTSVSLSEGFLLLILHQTRVPAGKSAETQEMQLTTETHKKSEFFKAVRDLPTPGIEAESPALSDGFFTTEPRGKPKLIHVNN
uniref:X-prolyl aminopeptidase 3 n=1 Tax=Ovis aries TaxID=9940 RepID=A0AC11CV89_SHEEP